MNKKLLILIGFLFFSVIIKSQNPPCYPSYNGLTFQVNNLDYVPPITFSMPYDVILGYLALDTLRRYSTPNDIETFLKRQTYNDTIRYIMKHYYKMVDYDPLKYKLTLYYPERRYIFPVDIDNTVLDNIERVSPYPLLDGMLFRSHIIAHILVTDTIRRIDTSTKFYPRSIIVTSQVLDTIKGRILPNCINFNEPAYYQRKNNNSLLDNQIPSNCLQFEYRLDWERGNEYSDLKLVDSAGVPWIKKDQEYIVFLQFVIPCSDSSHTYLDLLPFIKWSITCTMYPIYNSIVYDPGDDFGFGNNLSVIEFKSRLRARISEIINY